MKYIVWFSWWIDSVFVAWKLKQNWHEVLLINLKNTIEKNKCCEVPTKLFEIANNLGLSIKIIDVINDFKNIVIDNFIETYLRWKTPNPCINCNEFIRFKVLDKLRKDIWYDYVSTGHYVKKFDINWFYTFSIPKDTKKDQTYMLYRLLRYQDIVKHSHFPTWDFLKEDVKKILKDQSIPINTQKESQNICFIPDDNYSKFIKNNTNIKFKNWDILDIKTGQKLWEHNWVINYTIWQRKWLNLNINKIKYVISIDYQQNIIKVWDEQDLYSKKVLVDKLFYLKDYNWKIYWKIRYKSPLQEIENIEENAVFFKENIRAITSWQHLVLYWYNDWNYFVLWWWQIL